MSDAVVEERRLESKEVLQSLIDSRTEALAQYNLLLSQKPFSVNENTQEILQDFCQMLVDYTAKAHFNLYTYLEEKTERRQSVLDVAEKLYPKIVDNTQDILSFNDRYDCGDHCSHLNNLEADLSRIGEVLADRIEYEDKIIDAMVNSIDKTPS